MALGPLIMSMYLRFQNLDSDLNKIINNLTFQDLSILSNQTSETDYFFNSPMNNVINRNYFKFPDFEVRYGKSSFSFGHRLSRSLVFEEDDPKIDDTITKIKQVATALTNLVKHKTKIDLKPILRLEISSRNSSASEHIFKVLGVNLESDYELTNASFSKKVGEISLSINTLTFYYPGVEELNNPYEIIASLNNLEITDNFMQAFLDLLGEIKNIKEMIDRNE